VILYDRRTQILAACLSAVAGFVDAMAFREFGGFFVSFMSGNTTRLGVGLTTIGSGALFSGVLIVAFVAGSACGSFVAQRARGPRRAAVLLAVASLLALAAAIARFPISAVFMAVAMGAENAVFEEDGDVRLGLTYMTGTLAKLGQKLAGALTGANPWAWAPYLLLWSGLLAGAVLGAAMSLIVGLAGLWAAVAATLVLAAIFWRREAAGGDDTA